MSVINNVKESKEDVTAGKDLKGCLRWGPPVSSLGKLYSNNDYEITFVPVGQFTPAFAGAPVEAVANLIALTLQYNPETQWSVAIYIPEARLFYCTLIDK